MLDLWWQWVTSDPIHIRERKVHPKAGRCIYILRIQGTRFGCESTPWRSGSWEAVVWERPKVSLDKTLKPKFLQMGGRAPCTTAPFPSVFECVCTVQVCVCLCKHVNMFLYGLHLFLGMAFFQCSAVHLKFMRLSAGRESANTADINDILKCNCKHFTLQHPRRCSPLSSSWPLVCVAVCACTSMNNLLY